MRRSITLAFVLAAGASHAFFTTYTDRATWETDLGGPGSVTEDFSGFGTDADFSNSSVGINGGTLSHAGDNDFRNLVETPDFEFTDNNGTNHASMYVDATNSVTFDATNALIAYGAETWSAASASGASVDFFSGSVMLGSLSLSNASGAFHGFITDENVTAVVYNAPGNEGLSLDNIAMEPVPEPATMTLLGLGALAALRKKRKA